MERKAFFRFLKNENIYWSYFHYLRKHIKKRNIKQTPIDFVDDKLNNVGSSIFAFSFEWIGTREGMGFWLNKSRELRQYIIDLKHENR